MLLRMLTWSFYEHTAENYYGLIILLIFFVIRIK